MNKYIQMLLLFTFIVLNIAAQNQDVPKKIEALKQKKSVLSAQKQHLKDEIENLKSVLEEKNAELKSCNESLIRVKYGDDIAGRVAAGRVWKGMTEEMLHASWGKPDKVETTREKWGVFSQWYYGDIVYFFRDGKLQEWEEGYDKKKLDKEKNKE